MPISNKIALERMENDINEGFTSDTFEDPTDVAKDPISDELHLCCGI